ncbi:hypothetical protein UCDDA912_g02470 [Diaporthe ampelina]|uniref:Uncharacterized protein n=1 Tax=Diaporthe ampelina TaxID=1214573 RepID=A0A0G2ID36_9PEZI|nr:hypothetical protein UCDDA912_g02470 [Diaporthe ampelina]
MHTLQKAKEVIEENIRPGRAPTRPVSELEKFMEQVPTGSVVLYRLRMLQKVSKKNTEKCRLLTADIIYGLWWVFERKAKELDRVVEK